MESSGKTLAVIGFVSLLHAGYSAVQDRTYLKLIGEDTGAGLPSDIVFQTLISLIVAIVGIVGWSGDFRDIRAHAKHHGVTSQNLTTSSSFATYNHRGRNLFQSGGGKK
eukprot:Nk52_evm27s234 gene=Nk52_evmTU27s234